MQSTRSYSPSHTDDVVPGSELLDRYRAMVSCADVKWAPHCHDLRSVGKGGQGVVFAARREGADGFILPVSLKVFSPGSYRLAKDYAEDMGRVAAVAARVAAVQHENLIAVHNFTAHSGIRVMQMEWVDGYDLQQVLTSEMLDRTRRQLDASHLQSVEDVIFTDGPAHPRFKPGVAIHIIRDCLAALAALHRDGIIHGDLKPSNVMLKKSGAAKIIDIGSAVDVRLGGERQVWSPLYAAPEVLVGGQVTPQADIASLGYVLVEMIAGRSPFEGAQGVGGLIEAKRTLEHRIPELLPAEVKGSELLLALCRKLVAADPERRFPDAEAADLGRRGAAAFHRQLVKGDLSSEYGNDIRV
ncbi:MAG TPA: serine/threonine-protein kinase, partial [Urbifossiella sp.]